MYPSFVLVSVEDTTAVRSVAQFVYSDAYQNDDPELRTRVLAT